MCNADDIFLSTYVDDRKDVKQKSRKRKAAELKLAKRARSAHVHEGTWLGSTQQSFSLPNIEQNNRFPIETELPSTTSSFGSACLLEEHDWTSMPVDAPAQLDWSSVFSNSQYFCDEHSNGILKVMIVESDICEGLQWLVDSMTDRVVAIDLEWRPDSKHTNNAVACIQLATQTRCLLIRCCRWKSNNSLPKALLEFFWNPLHMFVAFSWDTGDEKKMCSTFGKGKDLFYNFQDIQKIGILLGYPEKCGLSALSRYVLGCSLPKSKFVSRSDWQKHVLSPGQVRYAAFDAFVTGYIFRTFRAWYECPRPCVSCNVMHGSVMYTDVKVCVSV